MMSIFHLGQHYPVFAIVFVCSLEKLPYGLEPFSTFLHNFKTFGKVQMLTISSNSIPLKVLKLFDSNRNSVKKQRLKAGAEKE